MSPFFYLTEKPFLFMSFDMLGKKTFFSLIQVWNEPKFRLRAIKGYFYEVKPIKMSSCDCSNFIVNLAENINSIPLSLFSSGFKVCLFQGRTNKLKVKHIALSL